ncbi:gfo/Idh/MocA family oxidoreductase [bacterium]|nr:gfo/Idh/MocA family oxidoreductase [bacterium]
MAKQWRIGVIGSTGRGNYGHGLDTAWQMIDETTVVAIADDNPVGLASTAKKLNVDAAFTDYRQMIETAKPDIIAIGPRWIDQHRDMALAAIDHGIHVFMEKPFVRTLQEADELVAACAKHKVKLAVGHPTRYSPMITTIRKLIADGAIGDVLEFRGRGKEDRRGGGEDLWVLGTHILDMIHAIDGKPEWTFARVFANGHSATRDDIVDGAEGIGRLVGDEVQATYGLPGGATAYFVSKRNAGGSPSRYGLQIFGSKGVLEIVEGTLPPVRYLGDPAWSPGRTSSEWQPVSSAGIGIPEPLSGPEYRARHTLAIRDLLAAIEQDREPIGNAFAARDVTEMIVSVFASHFAGQPLQLPLEQRANPLA